MIYKIIRTFVLLTILIPLLREHIDVTQYEVMLPDFTTSWIVLGFLWYGVTLSLTYYKITSVLVPILICILSVIPTVVYVFSNLGVTSCLMMLVLIISIVVVGSERNVLKIAYLVLVTCWLVYCLFVVSYSYKTSKTV